MYRFTQFRKDLIPLNASEGRGGLNSIQLSGDNGTDGVICRKISLRKIKIYKILMKKEAKP